MDNQLDQKKVGLALVSLFKAGQYLDEAGINGFDQEYFLPRFAECTEKAMTYLTPENKRKFKEWVLKKEYELMKNEL